jgi:hypothetical protein
MGMRMSASKVAIVKNTIAKNKRATSPERELDQL